ncbi:hypothetical protein KM043_005281 [Ampulex compressa]|nr:hypothetical protein KM043_005281 [Ampulex compressa]
MGSTNREIALCRLWRGKEMPAFREKSRGPSEEKGAHKVGRVIGVKAALLATRIIGASSPTPFDRLVRRIENTTALSQPSVCEA